MQFELHRQKLLLNERIAYDGLKNGIAAMQQAIKLSFISTANLPSIFNAVLCDHPEFFYTNQFQYATRGLGLITINPIYTSSKALVRELTVKSKQKIEILLRSIANYDEYKKEQEIHDFLCREVRYSSDLGYNAHTIVGALVYGKCVCEGIAKAAKFIFDMVGMESCVVNGKAKNPSISVAENHAWNIVKIHGDYYHLDITFDNTISQGNIRYDYFNLSDNEIVFDHTVTDQSNIKCEKTDFSYFHVNNLIMQKQKDFSDLLKSGMSKGQRYYLFKVPYVVNKKGVINKVTRIIEETLTGNLCYNIQYNENLLVFEVILM